MGAATKEGKHVMLVRQRTLLGGIAVCGGVTMAVMGFGGALAAAAPPPPPPPNPGQSQCIPFRPCPPGPGVPPPPAPRGPMR